MKQVVLCLLIASAAAVASAQEPVALREGIVVDSTRNVAYAMSVDGGITAVDLQTGEVRWKTKTAAKPIAVVDATLIAQVEPRALDTNVLDIAILDVTKKGKRLGGDREALADDVQVSTGQTFDGTFSVMALPSGGNTILQWKFTPSRVEREKLEQKVAPDSGALKMNLKTGAMTMAPEFGFEAPEPESRNWLLGVERDEKSKRRRTSYVSADGRHVLQSERIPAGDDGARYRWTIVERDTQKQVGQIRSEISFSPFVVRGSVITFETTPYQHAGQPVQPAKLRGVSLDDGKEVWSVPVRETVWRGSVPP